MDAAWDAFIHHARQEWAIVSGAPFLTVFMVALIVGVVWFVLSQIHKIRHATHESTVEQKDAHIGHLQSLVDDYQSKLSGATPDQAAKEIKSLRGELETARTEITVLTQEVRHLTGQRRLTEEQEKAISTALASFPDDMKGLVAVCSINEPEPLSYAMQILAVLQRVEICRGQIRIGQMLITSPEETGLLIVVLSAEQPPEHAALIMAAFKKAGVDIAYDQYDTPANVYPQQVTVMVSYKQPLAVKGRA